MSPARKRFSRETGEENANEFLEILNSIEKNELSIAKNALQTPDSTVSKPVFSIFYRYSSFFC